MFVYFSDDKACNAKRLTQNSGKFKRPVECCLYKKKYQAMAPSKLFRLNKGLFLARFLSGSLDSTHYFHLR